MLYDMRIVRRTRSYPGNGVHYEGPLHVHDGIRLLRHLDVSLGTF